MERRLLGGIPAVVASCALALTVIWLWGLYVLRVPMITEGGCLSFTINGVLINISVISETKNAVRKNTH